ncbi:heavy metal sensor histidine kinase [Geomonas sp. RF6]|uniref:heavy metal sensor histidine kinase n=1 Tax=Geomonas sp. RF6 TaxID=2897342 RepID=UPI001E3ACED4|nr:heavy metal sensor histidine kinase [Geomonas sp. RF6]UFS71058.1 heavy metal sensor histidine kinase [Geomonas sp. RF6]
MFKLRTLPIAFRLTAFYSIASAIILLALGLMLYSYTAQTLERNKSAYIADEINLLLDILSSPRAEEAIRQEMQREHRDRAHVVHHVRILDEQGKTLLEDPGMTRVLPPSLFPAPTPPAAEAQTFIKRRVADGNIYNMRAIRTDIRGFGGKARVVQVAIDVTRLTSFLNSLRQVIPAALFFGIILTSLAGAAIASYSLKPLHMITGSVERVTARRLGERIAAGELPEELQALATAFDRMLDRLEQSFDALSHYTGNLAHELRTPINSLMMEADIALMRPRTPEEYQKVIGSSMEEYERLSCMIDSLLFLARADNTSHLLRRRTLNVGEEVARICEFYLPVAADEGVALTSTGDASLFLDKDLFRKAVGNVISNALKYTPAGGEVKVAVRHRDERRVEVAISDTGCGIEPEHLPRIFDRFYRGSAEKRRDVQGSGLGLAIVKAIMSMHEGSIEVESRPGQGTTVSLLFDVSTSADSADTQHLPVA